MVSHLNSAPFPEGNTPKPRQEEAVSGEAGYLNHTEGEGWEGELPQAAEIKVTVFN